MKYSELVNLKVPAHDAYREIVKGKDCGKLFFWNLSSILSGITYTYQDDILPINDCCAMLTMGGEMY